MGVLSDMVARRLARHGIGKYDSNPGGRVYQDPTYRDLRLNGVVDLAPAFAKFVLANAAGSVFEPPSQMRQRIVAVGLKHDGEFNIRRFYLEEHSDEIPGYFLQVISTQAGVVDADTKIFMQKIEFNPATAEDWYQWVGGGDITEPLIGSLNLRWEDRITYDRVWGVSEPGKGALVVPPRQLTEVIDDGTPPERIVEHGTMLYGRQFGEGPNQMPEWVYVSVLSERDVGFTQRKWTEGHFGLSLTRAEFTAS